MTFKALGLTGGVITANVANVEHILKTNFSNYPKGELSVSLLEDLLGHGIFNSDGEQWLWQRKAASYEFNQRSLRSFVVDTVRFEVVERLLPLLEWARRDGRTLDVQDVLERFAFDNICHVVFHEDPACLAEDSMVSSQSAEFIRACSDAQNAIIARFMSPVKSLWRVKRLFNLDPERRMRDALTTIHGYADRIVRERRARGEAGLARSDDFLSRFAAGGEHSDESLRDVVTNFLIAGRDSTSSALTWFFWLVSSRPDVEDKIVHEIRAVRSASSSGGTSSTTFSLDELRDMHYLHAAITESMRLYPPVHLDTHSCKEEDFLPDGTFVGKGWLVTYCAYAMGRVEDIWGADCEEFRPERWLDEAGAFRPESPFKYPIYIPRWAKDVPRQGDGLHTDEVHRGVRARAVQPPVRRWRRTPRVRALVDSANGRRPADASDHQGVIIVHFIARVALALIPEIKHEWFSCFPYRWPNESLDTAWPSTTKAWSEISQSGRARPLLAPTTQYDTGCAMLV
jgi:cytochrome P450